MKRRDFFKACAATAVATSLPQIAEAGHVKRVLKQSLHGLDIRPLTIDCGASTPFKALHFSDSHLTVSDRRDEERKGLKTWDRHSHFPNAEYYLTRLTEYALQNDKLIIHTGDMIDFVSEAALDQAAMFFNQGDWLVSSGNHEFSQFVGEAKEDEAYKMQTFQKVQDAYPNDLIFYSRVINGINFVTLDNVYYYVTEYQRERMEQEVKKGLPIVLACHSPFYTPELCKFELQDNKCAYVTGAPLEITSKYDSHETFPVGEEWRSRSVQQKADKTTLDFVAWLKDQSLLKAILAGHLHHFFTERFSATAIQYVAGAGYNGEAFEITFR